MKTTIEIPDDLLRRAKQAALERDTTLRDIVEQALERALGPAAADVAPLRTVTWGPKRGARTRGVDADEILAMIRRDRDASAADPVWPARLAGTRAGRASK